MQTVTDLLSNLSLPEFTGAFLRKAETHISEVFIYEKAVFKIKKAVKFDFLDFSGPEKRRFFCEEEIRLNRRTCSDIYIGVFPVIRLRGSGDLFFDPLQHAHPEGEIADYCVVMKRLSEEGFLKNLLTDDFSYNRELLKKTADHLLSFYASAGILPAGGRMLQSPDPENIKQYLSKVRSAVLGNFFILEDYYKENQLKEKLEFIKYFSQYVMSSGDFLNILSQRYSSGCVKDLHGDLHLEHIHINGNGKVCIYDCTEFSSDFRTVDYACDLSFLSMDLEFRKYFRESKYVLSYVSEALSDREMISLFPFFKLYRAMVRAKVHALSDHYAESAAYLNLAFRILLIKHMPALIVVSGFPGSGKSVTASLLASYIGAAHFSSDAIRKRISGFSAEESVRRTPENKKHIVYSREISDRTYDELFLRSSESAAKDGVSVADASFMSRKRRDEFCKKAENTGIHIIWTEVYASPEVIIKRLKERSLWDRDASFFPHGESAGRETDARAEDYDTLKSLWEDMDADSCPAVKNRIRIRTDQDESLRELLDKIARNGLAV